MTDSVRSGARGFFVLAVLALLSISQLAYAQRESEREHALHFLRIGTGPPNETLYRYGSTLTSNISAPFDAVCRKGAVCGAAGVFLVTQSRAGVLESLRDLSGGALESALVYSAVLPALPQFFSLTTRDILLLAPITSVEMHILVRADSTIKRLGDLRNRAVVVGRLDSAVPFLLQITLHRAGLSRVFDAMIPIPLSSEEGLKALAQKRVDAVAVVGRAPIPSLQAFAQQTPLRLLDVVVAKPRSAAQPPLIRPTVVPALSYEGQKEQVRTAAFDVWWVVARSVPEDIVYAITRSLWHLRTTRMRDRPRFEVEILPQRKNDLQNIVLPLHPGAERWYRERGLLEKPEDLG